MHICLEMMLKSNDKAYFRAYLKQFFLFNKINLEFVSKSSRDYVLCMHFIKMLFGNYVYVKELLRQELSRYCTTVESLFETKCNGEMLLWAGL